jgi:hypothetical protein
MFALVLLDIIAVVFLEPALFTITIPQTPRRNRHSFVRACIDRSPERSRPGVAWYHYDLT